MTNCPNNTLLNNCISVPITELLTVDNLVIGGLVYYYARDMGSTQMLAIFIVSVIIFNVILHSMCIPSNSLYFAGYGKAPHRFKVCKCFA
jgi:hypothetical protein